MNILIVDDNKNNRMILELLLEDYMDENDGVEISTDEAVDGLEAVQMCKENSYDIVLMDIMMPNMDGIEATKLIRENDKKIMIIAVSAVNDSARQKLILSNGAEDYISKPVNADIFTSRMANYFTLIEARNHIKVAYTEKVNLFTENIFSRHIKFSINSEDTLSEFWEYYLLSDEDKYDNLSDVVRAIFALADIQVRLSITSEIYVEDSENYIYFSLTKIDEIPSKILVLTLKKNSIPCEYKTSDDKISFELEKICSVEELEIPVVEIVKAVEAPVVQEAVDSSVSFATSSEVLEVFDYLDPEDLNDLKEYAGKLNSLMLMVGSGDIEEEEIIEIYSLLDRLASILSTYSEVYDISKALSLLSNEMSTHMQEFKKYSEELGPMCKAFSNDLSNWIEMSFETGAPSVDFMNATIVVNCQTIGAMLKMDEQPADNGDDFDDIFDF